MANYSIEIERNNVTLAQFLRYVRQQCERKGIDFGIERESFEKPLSESSYGYTVINGEKKCHSAEYRTSTHLRRKLASYETQKGFVHYYYTDELEEYQKTRSEEHTSELQSRFDLVCRLLLEKKNRDNTKQTA